MTTREKDDDRNEKIIRALLKLPPNRRCINCDSIGPLYVVTNFSIFVCSMCAGIHREFSHRVKSVSIATFTPEEVIALQRGGNEVAKEIFFKEWDLQSRFDSKSSNMQRLRNLIKQVYVERRYTGEKSIDKPSNVKNVNIRPRTTEMDAYVSHYMERCRSIESDGQSTPMSDYSERTLRSDYGKRTPRSDYGVRTPRSDNGERRSLRYGQQSKRRDNYKKISARFEVVDDRYHKSRSGSLEETYFPEMVAMQEVKAINHKKEMDSPRPRGVRSLREVLDKIPSLRVTNPPKGNVDKDSDSSIGIQITPSISKKVENHMEVKKPDVVEYKKVSLQTPSDHINAKPAPNPQLLSTSTSTSLESTKSPIDNNWAKFDCQDQVASTKKIIDVVSPQFMAPEVKSRGHVTNTNVTDIMLLDVNNSVPLSPICTSITSNNMSTSLFHGKSSASNVARLGAPSPLSETNNFLHNASHWELGLGMQLSQPSVTHDIKTLLIVPVEQSSPVVSKQNDMTSYRTESQSDHTEKKSNTAKELPQELFTATYSPVHVPSLGWQPVQARGMAYDLHYPLSSVQAFSQPITSRNPFDLNDQTQSHGDFYTVSLPASPAHAMATGVSPLPSSIGSSSPSPQLSPYVMSPSHSLQTYDMSPWQQMPNKLTYARYARVGTYGNNGSTLDISDPNQQFNGRVSTTSNSRSSNSSHGGNPFA